MPNILRQYFKPTPTVPDPPNQDRVIHIELTHHFTSMNPVSWVGEPEPENPLPDAIAVSLSHAF